MIIHHIFSLSCMLAWQASTKSTGFAFVYGRSHVLHGVALNHLFATRAPSSQPEKDGYGTNADNPTLYEDANSMIKGNVFNSGAGTPCTAAQNQFQKKRNSTEFFLLLILLFWNHRSCSTDLCLRNGSGMREG
jgi:hypothetical protein